MNRQYGIGDSKYVVKITRDRLGQPAYDIFSIKRSFH